MSEEAERWNLNANKAAEKYADAMGYTSRCLERTIIISAFISGLAYTGNLNQPNYESNYRHTQSKKDMENTKDADAVGIESTALFGILRYVANECQKHPSDSVKDIVNEAFDDYGLPFYAEWSDNDDQPISILPNA